MLKRTENQHMIFWMSIEVSLMLYRIALGEASAFRHFSDFIETKLESYESRRNYPSLDGQSNLSTYLHFGQISVQRIVLNILRSKINAESFLEELYNCENGVIGQFSYFNKQYDSFEGFPRWARENLDKHRDDERVYLIHFQNWKRVKLMTIFGTLHKWRWPELARCTAI